MSPLLYQLLTTGDLKLCQLMEDDDNSELPPIHTVFLTMRKAVYAIIFNVHHTSYCRLTVFLLLSIVVLPLSSLSQFSFNYHIVLFRRQAEEEMKLASKKLDDTKKQLKKTDGTKV